MMNSGQVRTEYVSRSFMMCIYVETSTPVNFGTALQDYYNGTSSMLKLDIAKTGPVVYRKEHSETVTHHKYNLVKYLHG